MLTLIRTLGQFFRPDPRIIFSITFSLILAACGGGGGGVAGGIGGSGGPVAGGIGGTGSVAAIASVTVNGVKFSCVGAVVTDDDGTLPQPAPGKDPCLDAEDLGRLSVGSIVTVTGTKDSNGNPIATTVDISKSVFGPARNIDVPALKFSVLGQTVQVDQSTQYKGLPSGLTSLVDGDTVEVSGFRTTPTGTFPNGTIRATLVEKKSSGSGEVELKGLTAVNGNAVSINGINITLTGGEPTPANNLCVEAKGTFTGNTLTLTQALKRDNDCSGGSALPGSLDSAKVEGVITGFSSQSNFTVDRQTVNGSGATISGGTAQSLLNGAKVEVEGTLTGGVLVATKIQIKSTGVRLEGVVDSVSGGSFNIFGITITSGTGTQNNAGTINIGSRIRVEGNKSGSAQVNASRIDNASGGGGGSQVELSGPVDANPTPSNFTILGVPIRTSGSTKFNGTTGSSAETSFFNATHQDNIVSVKGAENTNNEIAADEVENDD